MNSLKKLLPYVKPHAFDAIIAPLLMVLEVSMDLAQPRFLQTIVDQGIGAGDFSVVLSTGVLMIVFAIIGAVGGIGCTVFAVRAAQKTGADIRSGLFRKVQSFSFGNFDKIKTGELVTRLTNDVVQVQEMIMILLRIMIRAPALLVGSLIMAVVTSVKLSVILMALVPILSIILVRVTRRGYPLFSKVQSSIDGLNTVMRENLAGVRVVKAFVRHSHEERRFSAANEELMARTMQAMRLMAVVMPLSMLVVNAGVVAVIWYGGFNVTTGLISVGQIMAFVNYLLQALNSMMMVGMLLVRVSRAMASADRIDEVMRTEPLISKPSSPVNSTESFTRASTWALTNGGSVEFLDVGFSYDGETVLRDISFKADTGQKVAILGATGTGKSTLIHLIPRFYDADTGSVMINGVDVRMIEDSQLRSSVSIVQQEPILFSGTIAENLAYGNPEADDDDIRQAAQMAQAHNFISALPEGYYSVIGQRGVNLSGGQKQRLAIARALAVKPAILVLDDCTSAVDVETEAKIQDALAAGITTTILVAQRISSVLTSDLILVMDDGQITARGNHRTLMDTSPLYRDIFDSQLGSGRLSHGR